MAIEIERKFLVADTAFLAGLEGECLVQGYIASGGSATVRVRRCGELAWLTLKGRSVGISRSEFEYPIPPADAERMLAELCAEPVISKTRYRVPCGDHLWEVDVFDGANTGLVVAEIELTREDEAFAAPAWLGAEVSGDPRYFNSRLAEHPYRNW
ncbi:MAG: CYTH domain-containing protein [Gammaproteobacteria bacterium]|nr:CYTH domain-containing protein [Gammaproteobacteria bacterium]